MLHKYLKSLLTLMLAAFAAASLHAQTVRVGYQTGDINVLLLYASQTEQFKKAGLDIRLVPFPAGPAMLPALAAKEVDLAWMGEVPVVTAFSNGAPLEILLAERLDETNHRLVVRPAAGIGKLSDLKGKRVGVSLGSTGHYHLLQALHQAGLSPADVTVVNLAPAAMPPAYLAGQIDAAITWEPNVGLLEKAGAKPIATTRSLGLVTGGFWVARSAFTHDQPQAVQTFFTVWRQAQKDYQRDPGAVRQYEAKRVQQTPAEFDALIAGQSATHPSFEEQLTPAVLGAPGKETDAILLKHFRNIGQFLLDQKRVQQLPSDWKPLVNTQPIQAVLAAEKRP
ncbi:MAG: NrtA/SsuA/CpmA family ABC transporter substrate-binding protein [Xenophilus sp.]